MNRIDYTNLNLELTDLPTNECKNIVRLFILPDLLRYRVYLFIFSGITQRTITYNGHGVL